MLGSSQPRDELNLEVWAGLRQIAAAAGSSLLQEALHASGKRNLPSRARSPTRSWSAVHSQVPVSS